MVFAPVWPLKAAAGLSRPAGPKAAPGWLRRLLPIVGNARFNRRVRLVNKADFQNVFAKPIRSGDRYFTVLAQPNHLGFPRLGLAISRKSAKSAVMRNRIKRVVRESFRRHQHQLDGFDFVVIGRPKLAEHDNTAFFDSLERHWANLKEQCARS